MKEFQAKVVVYGIECLYRRRAKISALSDKEQVVHAESARWVRRTLNSSKRGYVNKNAMNMSLFEFMAKSGNGYMALLAGLEKGSRKLKDSPEEGRLSLIIERITDIDEYQPEKDLY